MELLKRAAKILEAIEALPGTKYVIVGVLPTDTYAYVVTSENISGNRVPILSAMYHAMDIGGTLLVKHLLPLRSVNDVYKMPTFHVYALLLGDKKYRVCNETEFKRFFKQPGMYRKLKVELCDI